MPTPPQPPIPRSAPSQSTLLLLLGGLCLLSLPLMLLWPAPQAHTAAPLALQAPPQPLPSSGSLKLDALAASVEREPLNVPTDPDADWTLPPTADDALLPAMQALSDAGLSDEALAEALAQAAQAPAAATAGVGSGDPVSAYLQELEFALMSGGFWQDPQQLGMQVVQEMMGGDVSGLGQLRSSNSAVLGRVRAIQPPQGCEEHHRLTMQVIQTGDALLSEWASAIERGDIDAIASATARAEGLRRDAARVDALTARLQQQAR